MVLHLAPILTPMRVFSPGMFHCQVTQCFANKHDYLGSASSCLWFTVPLNVIKGRMPGSQYIPRPGLYCIT